jgi:hypothetical protein
LEKIERYHSLLRHQGRTDELIISPYVHRLKIIGAYTDWVENLERFGREDQIYYASLVTLQFNHIPGDIRHRKLVMADEADRIYRTFLRHVLKNPRDPSKQHLLPIWILPFDLPTKKTRGSPKAIMRDVTINDGLHLGGVMLISTETKMKQTLTMHMDWKSPYYPQYVRPDRPLRRLDVTPIELGEAGYVTDYAMKSLKWKIPDLDDLLIFPKALSELPDRPGRQFRRSEIE